MQIKPLYIKPIIGIFIVLMAASCSTEKDALINRGYHNMTARYNGYYNAGVIIDEMLEGYRESYQEDYVDVIPLDLYPTELDAPNVFPELEDAIERCSKVIVRHSMPNPELVTNKSNENCKWIDDNWLVVGQAYYIKREYKEAREKLQYIAESDFYRGEEAVYEARIWLAKTHIAMGEYPQAKRVLKTVEQSIKTSEAKKENKEKKKKPSKLERQRAKKAKKSGKKGKDKEPAEFPKRLKVEYEIAMADLYLAQEENKKAITHLENAVDLGKKDKKRRARHMFALGQLYSEEGNNDQASNYFSKVIRSNAPYEMRFKAKIKNALTSSGNTNELVAELEKMLKDGKNIEYKDQIYYALAELDMKQDSVASAKSNYTNSVLWSIKNNRQKGQSYLRLADIHFEERDYLSAQKYYDSCVKVLPEDYENYEFLKNKALGLADLVYNYELVEYEDSVQKIAIMSPREREKFLKQTIKDIEAEKERKRIEEEQRLLAQQERINNQAGGGGANGAKKGKGYFSNPKQVASGFNDFRGLWGQRPLEDNWRRTNKNAFNEILNDDGEPIDSAGVDELTVDMLMEDIPLTQSALDSSNFRILNSLYALGIIYKEQLKEEKEAVNYFQAVLDRNIEHPRVLPALYQLYLINKKNGNGSANGYKSTILKDYPESEIAQILQDPDYLQKKELKDREELNEYAGVMRNYRRRSYGLVISACNEVILQDTENKFLEKYYLLKAFAVSKVSPGNKEAISDPLTKLYEMSPDTEEGMQAKVYLDQIKGGGAIVAPDPGVISPYKYDPDSKHFFMLVIPNDKGDVAETKIRISNFNGVFFKNDGLTMQDAPLGATHQILVVRSFKDLTGAESYINSFESKKAKETIKTLATDYEICLINTKNFSELFKIKDIAQYMEFYKANY